ncbi:MAG: peptidase S16 [Actinobacteria bacterium 13_2_20CM_2_72_6]|nr:MAG: peptidase S16 [Actinobacteria bacterium 13_2_20CM_2_72_6]
MTQELPLFPLGTVLFPGLVLPLHVFEERYQALVRQLVERPEGTPREFGVVAIRRGWEVEQQGALTLHDVGCIAQVRQVTAHPDGRYDLTTVGTRRFTVRRVDADREPFLVAEVDWLDEPAGPGEELDRLVPTVLDLFQRYLRLIRPAQVGEQVPEDPTVLSHVIAAAAALSLDERQALLAAPDTAARLRAERALLRREVALLGRVRAIPVPLSELAVTTSPN